MVDTEKVRRSHSLCREYDGETGEWEEYCEECNGDFPCAVVQLVDELDAARKENERLREALRLTLLFHSGSPWDDSKRLAWLKITGVEEATTKVLCDTIRAALGEKE